MEYKLDQECFNKNFGAKFTHKTNMRYNLFPFTGSTSDKVLDSFDNILGAFLRNVYSVNQPDTINQDEIITGICEDVDFSDEASKSAFSRIIKDIYFVDDNTLRCTSINTYKYTISTKNDNKISEYIVSALCDRDAVIDALSKKKNHSSNVLDTLVESKLPELSHKDSDKKYISVFPQIREKFTKDLIFLINDDNSDFNEMIQLISYYYFFYTSQVIIYLNRFCNADTQLQPIYFCMSWEKTSKSRACQTMGWRQIESKLNTMFSHAVLLEMINQTGMEQSFSYTKICDIYTNANDCEKQMIFESLERLKENYRNIYAEPDGFSYKPNSYEKGNIDSLIREFFDDIMTQFKYSVRSRVNEAYQSSFYEFCRNNYLQNRKTNGLILVLTEEQLVLLTKIIIADAQQMRLNTLFKEFESRGIFMDSATKECVVEFYEKLNLIEKKSDSGDAQYVKGIL